MPRPVTRRFVLMMYILLGLFLVSLAVPLIRHQVAPNSWYGFRVPETLGDPKVWYSANAYAGWFLLTAGVAVSLAAVGLYPGRRRLRDAAYAVTCSFVLLGTLLATFVMTWLYLRTLVPGALSGAMHAERSVTRFMVIVYLFIGLMLVGLAVPLVRGRVRPNRWYGFRVQETLEDPDVWYAVNSYSGRLLLGLGVIVAATAIGLALVPSVDVLLYMLGCTMVLVGGLLLGLVLSFRYLHTLKPTGPRRVG